MPQENQNYLWSSGRSSGTHPPQENLAATWEPMATWEPRHYVPTLMRHRGTWRPKMMQNSYVIIKAKKDVQFIKTEKTKMTVKSNVHDRETKCSWPSPWDQMFITLTVEIPKSSWPSPPKKWKVRDPPCFFGSPLGALNNDHSLIMREASKCKQPMD